MKCSELEKHWEEWLEGAVPAEVEHHLRECPRCRERAAELAQTSAWLGLLPQPPHEPGPAFWARLKQRLEESEQEADFWQGLTWVSSRVALALGALVLLLAAWVLQAPPQPAVAEFDAPQTYLQAAAALPPGNAQLNRDQVVLTLVAQREPQQ